ncbi:MAG: TlyA family RNA methyltransferase [Chloroflexota bacterium]
MVIKYAPMNPPIKKIRVDRLLVERGLAETRSLAQRLIMAGQVRMDDQIVAKPSLTVSPDVEIVIESDKEFFSRAGQKLQAALEAFHIDVTGKVCADVGASTGGFTGCLLKQGAVRVYAIDVGYGLLHWELRNDPRVVAMERTNARYLQRLAEPVSLVTVDVSFISVKHILPVIRGWFSPEGGEVIALIKPQFEAGRREAAQGKGVIRDPQIHRRVLFEVLERAHDNGYGVENLAVSPILGPKGNVEFLTHLCLPGRRGVDLETLVDRVLVEASRLREDKN